MGFVVLADTDFTYVLSVQSSIFVGPNATLYSTTVETTPIIDSPAAGRTVRIEGTVLGQNAYAISMTLGGHTVVVGEGGSVFSNRDWVTMLISGPDVFVQNFGLVSGGAGIWGSGWGGGRIENDGTIAAQRYAAVKLMDGVGPNTILNSGLITGTGGIVLEDATATIVNRAGGEIRSTSAAVAAVDGTDAGTGFVLRNAGTVMGLDEAILGSALADTVRNEGAIIGDVRLAGGNDLFRGRPGTIDGELRGGNGNDTLITGQGDDSLFGDAGFDRLDGGAGDDSLTGGGGGDVFVFTRAGKGGADTIADFADGQDDLDLAAFGFTGFAAVAALATDLAGGMLLDLDDRGGGTVFVRGFAKAQFDAGDVLL